MSQQTNYPLRIPAELKEKIMHVAEQNGRSTNKEIEMLIKLHVEKFESEKGKIHVDKE